MDYHWFYLLLTLVQSCLSAKFIDGGTMVSPTVFARRCLCYLLSDMPQEALGDAMQAQVISPDWPTAFYLQAAALFGLGMNNDAQETLKDGTNLEAKKHRNWKVYRFPLFFFFSLFLLAFYLNIHCIYLSFTTLAIGFLQHHRISCNIYMLMMLVMLLLLSSQTRPKESHSLFLESSSILKNLWFFKCSIRKFPDESGLKFWTAFKFHLFIVCWNYWSGKFFASCTKLAVGRLR